MEEFTRKFNVAQEKDAEIRHILTTVYAALEDKGYNPINQIVGYILSEDPTYITNHNNARTLIRKLDRDELLQTLVRSLVTRTGVSQMAEATEGLVYRGHPLRRVDNLIYYGSMADKYIVMMQVLDTTPLKDITLAKRVSIQLQMTDASLRSRDRVVRSTEKGSLGEAMEFASIWLERALSGKM